MRSGTAGARCIEHPASNIGAGSVLLVLGGTAFQIPAILHAVKLGCRVITCDYLPQNPGHRLAHHYVNASTTDADAILAIARQHRVDGILAYASDPSAPTAAAVTAQLQLPGCPSQSIATLTNKASFRRFLREHGFRAPRFGTASTAAQACVRAGEIGFPVMIKPVDSSGSKGVTRVSCMEDVAAAAADALRWSRAAQLIVEEWIERDGQQIAGDGLVVSGQLVFGGFGDEHFDPHCSLHAPIGESLPGQLSLSSRTQARTQLLSTLQRLFNLLEIRDLVFNLDALIDRDGQIMLIEIGPRAGGNALPQLIQLATGVDLTDIAIRQALGIAVAPALYQSETRGCFASHILHSRTAGRFAGFRMAPSLQPHAIEVTLTARLGDAVNRFSASKDMLGYGLFGFPDATVMREQLATISDSFVPLVA